MLNKILTKLQQKYSSSSLFQKGGFLAPTDEQEREKEIKLPLFRLMFAPLNQILDNGKIFFSLALPAALLICLSSTMLGFNYLCSYGQPSGEVLYCSNSLYGYIGHSLIRILIFGYVGIKWYEYVNAGVSFAGKTLFSVDRRCLIFSGYLFLFLILNLLPLLSWWVLYVRVPDPNWQVEMVFFAFVSIGFLMPIILLRFYTVLGFAMRGQKREKLSDIWNKTSGNTLKIFLSFMLILTIGMFIFGNLYTNFKSLTGSITILNQLLSEYVYDFFSLFLYIVVINNINMQYDILYASTEGDENI